MKKICEEQAPFSEYQDFSDDDKVPEGKKEVAIVYDERMLLHKFHSRKHYERPERLTIIHTNFLIKNYLSKCKLIPPALISEENLLLVHSQNHIEKVKSTQFQYLGMEEKPLPEGKNTSKFSKETYENYWTYLSSCVSAWCSISAVYEIEKGTCKKIFCINRPAGHHAGVNSVGGFCFFNNCAIAARYAQKKYNIKKIAIVDWDVHYGNGTSEIFYSDDNVLYISLHRYDNGQFYPKCGSIAEIGTGKGEGFNLNIPWNNADTQVKSLISDREYFEAFETIILPVLKEFSPELLIISNGYDAIIGDNIGKLSLSEEIYYYMTFSLKEICQKLIFLLEGGYNLKMLSKGSEASIKALLNLELKEKNIEEIKNTIRLKEFQKNGSETLKNVLEIHKKYWKCLN